MSHNEFEYDRKEMRERLTQGYSRDEIRIICFDLGVDYEELSDEKSMLVIDLLKSLQNKKKMHLLRDWLSDD